MALIRSTDRVSLVTWYRINDLPAGQEVIGDVNNRHLGVVDLHGRPKPASRGSAARPSCSPDPCGRPTTGFR